MAAPPHKHFLHELLKQDQEPFRLKRYISDKQSQLNNNNKKPSHHLPLRKRNRTSNNNSSSNFRKHACFFSFHASSPDVRKSPLFDFPSPASRSPNGAVSLLVEAAMRVHKQQMSRTNKAQVNKNVGLGLGLGLFGSLVKRLTHRSKNKKRAIGPLAENEASTSSCGYDQCFINCDFEMSETRFCESPFRFSLRRSPPSSASGRRTPEFCSPASSPSRRVIQKENYKPRKSDDVRVEEEEDKEQCSPVSVLDPPFEDDGRESRDADEDDYDLECSYENVQRARQQLLYRLRRFEKLAELDPIELERKLMEGSDEDEEQGERDESEDDEQLSLYERQSVETILSQVINQSSLKCHSRNMSDDLKKLVSDLIVEEKSEIVLSGNNEVVMGRICSRLDSWREVESNTIDMMVGFDFKREFSGWTRFNEQVDEITAEIEVAIYGLLVEELSDELF